MRILLISHFFPPRHTAGTENYTAGVARNLLVRGHDVHVICAEDWQEGASYWNGVTQDIYQGIPVERLHLNWMKARTPNQVLYDSLEVESWLDERLRCLQPDVVHVTSTYSLGVGVLRSAHRASIPLVLTLMDFWFLCPRTVLMQGDGQLCSGHVTPSDCAACMGAASRLHQTTQQILPPAFRTHLWDMVSGIPFLERINGIRGLALNMQDRGARINEALDLPDCILSHSRFVQRMFADLNVSDRVLYLKNGHDLSWVSQCLAKTSTREVRIGYMGQISSVKGVHILIEAFKKAQLGARARLDIWGVLRDNDAYVQHLQSLIKGEVGIRLRGRFERAQLPAVLADMDVLVVPSIWYENAPLVIQEAFAAKTPVIATNLGGMAEAVTHEVNGLLFERGNALHLAEQLRQAVFTPGLLDQLAAGIPMVKTVDEEVAELEDIYRGLMLAKAPVTVRSAVYV